MLVSLVSVLSSWERVPTAHSPTGRTSGAMCALNGGGLLVFGGSDGETGSHFKNDLWVFTEGDWHEVSVTGTKPDGKSNAGMVAYENGAVLFGGFQFNTTAASPLDSLYVTDDTWLFTPDAPHRGASGWSGTWRLLKPSVSPSPRAYFTFTNYLGGASGLLFGGRNDLFTNPMTALMDTWVFENMQWRMLTSTVPSTERLQSLSQPTPSKRWGQVVACGLNATVPTVHASNPGIPAGIESFVGPADCMLFGGAVTADEDYLSDTWLLYRNGGVPVWKQQNDWPRPRGRWCHAAARCAKRGVNGSSVVMLGGSIDYRVSDIPTWMWSPSYIPHEESTANPGHPPGHTGVWTNVADGSTGPDRVAGHMMATDYNLGVVVFGGAGPATGGNHPGLFQNGTWRWTAC